MTVTLPAPLPLQHGYLDSPHSCHGGAHSSSLSKQDGQEASSSVEMQNAQLSKIPNTRLSASFRQHRTRTKGGATSACVTFGHSVWYSQILEVVLMNVQKVFGYWMWKEYPLQNLQFKTLGWIICLYYIFNYSHYVHCVWRSVCCVFSVCWWLERGGLKSYRFMVRVVWLCLAMAPSHPNKVTQWASGSFPPQNISSLCVD